MKHTHLLIALLLAFASMPASNAAKLHEVRTVRGTSPALNPFAAQSLRFEANAGQAPASVDFLARTGATSILLERDKFTIAAPGVRINLRPLDRDSTAAWEGAAASKTKVHYFLGSDPAKWRNDIPTYSRVIQTNVWRGIGLACYGNSTQFEYDLILDPGADPGRIRMAVDGATHLEVTRSGDLSIGTARGNMLLLRPRVYQERDGKRHEIAGRYTVPSPAVFGFEIGDYDPAARLIIDPILQTSALFGGIAQDEITAIANGTFTYLAGHTFSADLTGRVERPGGETDAFLAAIGREGEIAFFAYIGGDGADRINAISMKLSRIVAVGETSSRNFPIVTSILNTPVNPAQRTYGGGASDAFQLEFDLSNNRLAYSTYFGGREADRATAAAVDGFGNTWIGGETASADLPVTQPLQPALAGRIDGFVANILPTGLLGFSTFLGGTSEDRVTGLAFDDNNQLFLSGETRSEDFPLKDGFQPSHGGLWDTFVSAMELRESGSPGQGIRIGTGLRWATFLGGSGDDRSAGLRIASDRNLWVAGSTASRDFPLAGPNRREFAGGDSDIFLASLHPETGALKLSNLWGGSADDVAAAIAVSIYGDIYITGRTASPDFPVQDPLQSRFAGGDSDAFVMRFRSSGALHFSTYFGGSSSDASNAIAVNELGAVWIAGRSGSEDFPIHLLTRGAGNGDGFAASISAPEILVSGLTLGRNLQSIRRCITGTGMPEGGSRFTVTSSDPSKLLVSSRPDRAGTASVDLDFDYPPQAGERLCPSFYLQALSDSGDVPFTVSAPGYETATATVTLARTVIRPVNLGPVPRSGLFAPTLRNPDVAISAELITIGPGERFVFGADLRAGAEPVALTFRSSNPDVGVVSPASAVINPGQRQATTLFQARGLGVTQITIAGSGYEAGPFDVAVVQPSLVISAQPVGQHLAVGAAVRVNAPIAPEGVEVTLRSEDPGLVLLSRTATESGTPSVTLRIPAPSDPRLAPGASFWVHGLAGTGTVKVRATGAGVTDAEGSINLFPSAFYFSTPTADRSAFTLPNENLFLTVGVAAVQPETRTIVSHGILRPGREPVQLSISNSNPAVGTLAQPTITFAPGDPAKAVPFRAIAAGETEISLSTPEGFVAPATGQRKTIALRPPGISISMMPVTVGRNLQTVGYFLMDKAAPAGGLRVTVRSADPSKVRLTTSPASAGTGEVTFTISPGSIGPSSRDFWIQGWETGNTEIIVSGENIAENRTPITVAPSGFIFTTSQVVTKQYAAPIRVQIQPGVLNPSGLFTTMAQELRGGLPPVTLELVNTLESTGSFVTPLLPFPFERTFFDAEFRPTGTGDSKLRIRTPAGFSTPLRGAEIPIRVTPPAIRIADATVADGLQRSFAVAPETFPPDQRPLTITSSDPSRLLLSLSRTSPGSPTVVVRPPTGLGYPGIFLQGFASEGSATVTASMEGYEDGRATVTLAPASVGFYQKLPAGSDGVVSLLAGGSPGIVEIGMGFMDSRMRFVFAERRAGADSLTVELRSSNSEVLALDPQRVTFNGDGARPSIRVIPKSPGSVSVTILSPAEFAVPPPAISEMQVTVRLPILQLQPVILGIGQQRAVAAQYRDRGLGLRTVMVESADPSKVLLARTPGEAGAPRIEINANFLGTDAFYVQALRGEGIVNLRLFGDGLEDGSGEVRLGQSRFAFSPFLAAEIRLPLQGPVLTGEVVFLTVDSQGVPIATGGALRSGLSPVSVSVVSSDDSIVSVGGSPLQFQPGDGSQRFTLQPRRAGTAVITITQPSGFLEPATPLRVVVGN